ncbi:MAG: zinc-ribbon domain-containing protein, partial [Clostridia bacterium]|nr:zinc-ribbon domain-containing protein [Clostridia bacterium]
MATCVNCGEELKESEAVCPVCGTLVLHEENKEDEQSEKPAENTPVKEKDDWYSYTFEKWTPDITEANENATYTASFKAEKLEYKAT